MPRKLIFPGSELSNSKSTLASHYCTANDGHRWPSALNLLATACRDAHCPHSAAKFINTLINTILNNLAFRHHIHHRLLQLACHLPLTTRTPSSQPHNLPHWQVHFTLDFFPGF